MPAAFSRAATVRAGATSTAGAPLPEDQAGEARAATAGPASAGAPGRDDLAAGELGEIDFPTSGPKAAQPAFLRGVLLLHSFEYEDAAAAFREAAAIAPGFAMAAWGEAMTHNHPLWSEQDVKAGREALGRLAPTPEARLAKAPTEREKGYLRAVEALYGEGDKADRDRAYAAAMGLLHQAHPEDLDAASLYALALLGTCEHGREIPTYMRAAAIVEEVFARNPRHPGAAHYLIHSYDDPVHGPLGLRAARAYARIAPAAAHALHMPSHIFLALGLWDDVAASNEASWAASEARRERLRLPLDARGYHAYAWLEYAYLQQGRLADAARLLAGMRRDAQADASPRIRHHLALMRAAWLAETGRREQAGPPADTTALGHDLAAADLAASGFAALRAGDLTAARTALAQLGANHEPHPPEQASQAAARGTASPAGGATPPPLAAPPPGHQAAAYEAMGGAAGHQPATAASILEEELAAALDFASGRREAALARLAAAAAAEDGMSYEFGPPAVVKPTHELAGELLLELGRPAAARAEFEASLARAPRRSLSLLGLARAASQTGDRELARRTYSDLASSWREADPDLPELSEVRAGARSPALLASSPQPPAP